MLIFAPATAMATATAPAQQVDALRLHLRQQVASARDRPINNEYIKFVGRGGRSLGKFARRLEMEFARLRAARQEWPSSRSSKLGGGGGGSDARQVNQFARRIITSQAAAAVAAPLRVANRRFEWPPRPPPLRPLGR